MQLMESLMTAALHSSNNKHADPNSLCTGLADYSMQEPLLHGILPHLRPAALARLRATCTSLRSLLDSELCSEAWFEAAKHLLPGIQQLQAHDWHATESESLRIASSETSQHQPAGSSSPSKATTSPKWSRDGHACQLTHAPAAQLPLEHPERVQQLLRLGQLC